MGVIDHIDVLENIYNCVQQISVIMLSLFYLSNYMTVFQCVYSFLMQYCGWIMKQIDDSWETRWSPNFLA